MTFFGTFTNTSSLDLKNGVGAQSFGGITSDTMVDVGSGLVRFGSLLSNAEHTFTVDQFPLTAAKVADLGLVQLGTPAAIFRWDMATNAALDDELDSAFPTDLDVHGTDASTSVTSTDYSPDLAVSVPEAPSDGTARGWAADANSEFNIGSLENFAGFLIVRVGELTGASTARGLMRKRAASSADTGWALRFTGSVGLLGTVIKQSGTAQQDLPSTVSHKNALIAVLFGRTDALLFQISNLETLSASLLHTGSLTNTQLFTVGGKNAIIAGPEAEYVYGMLWRGAEVANATQAQLVSDMNILLAHFGFAAI